MNFRLAEKLAEMDRRRASLAATVEHYRKKNDELEAAQLARGDGKFAAEAFERLERLSHKERDHG